MYSPKIPRENSTIPPKKSTAMNKDAKPDTSMPKNSFLAKVNRINKKENPEIIKEFANKLGYWYFVNSVDFDADGDLVLEWENRGAAHAFNRYYLFAKIKGKGFEKIFPLLSADNRKWEPDSPVKEAYKLPLAEIPSGDYELSIGMKTSAKKDARVIELGFNEKLRDSDGFYRILKFRK